MEKSNILSRVARKETITKLPLVEILGQHRVLIENHQGVIGYSLEEIQIKVTYGKMSVVGSELRFIQISKEQLVITGNIDAVALHRR